MDYASIRREETHFMDVFYKSFEDDIKKLRQDQASADRYYQSGGFEDQDAFTAANDAYKASDRVHQKKLQYKELFEHPYFAHLSFHPEHLGIRDDLHIFLSDNENLESMLSLSSDPNSMIIPFKQDDQRPFLTAAFHCYQAKDGEPLEVTTTVKYGEQHSYIYDPLVIRDVDVHQKRLGAVICYLPKGEGLEQIDADEMLAQQLDENREDAILRNIISTLQYKQFDIIRTNIKTSFIVQGCAGSGKTQCLIHRLFFLRDTLKGVGWEKVLLITPTQLFRKYSAQLIKRYRLESVSNMSLAGMYKMLLESYDYRFSGRQYVFELTEEYLPDGYLNRVYAQDQINQINQKIEEAIVTHVEEGCRFAEIDTPPATQININFINNLSDKLEDLLEKYDQTERERADDLEYQRHRREVDILEKKLRQLERKLGDQIDTLHRLEKKREQFDTLRRSCETAKLDLNELTTLKKASTDRLVFQLNECITQIENGGASRYPFIFDYAQLCRRIVDMYDPQSDDAVFEAEYYELLREIYQRCQDELNAFTDNAAPDRWLKKHTQQVEQINIRIQTTRDDIISAQQNLEEHTTWLKSNNVENAENQRKSYRSELSKVQNYLSRIESAVFEQEVWNALTPLKEEFGITTLSIEQLDTGKQKQSRLLYKSDLLFYLNIYARLHDGSSLPNYSLICIDEGQDLHPADYSILKRLYPSATFNIFGDLAQVLHTSCGIGDWTRDTGINTVYELTDNYRNTPAIVDFCNRRFGSNMTYIGKLNQSGNPILLDENAQNIVSSISEAGVAIVRDRVAFNRLKQLVEGTGCNLEFVDTKAEVAPENAIPCYSIFAAKGLEFPSVVVYAANMTDNQKVVACTRAMKNLYYCESLEGIK
jgi:exonuclease VII large subunit